MYVTKVIVIVKMLKTPF